MMAAFPEPIRILSDLHLGHEACALPDANAIRPLLEGARTVVFNGDTIEVRARAFKRRAAEERERLDALLKELGVEKVLFLTGNHDPRISDCHHLELCEGKLLVTHGDFLFRYVSPWSQKLRHCRPKIDAILEDMDKDRWASDLEYRLAITRDCCDVLEVIQKASPEGWRGVVSYYAKEFWPPTRLFTIAHVWLRSPALMAAALEQYRPQSQAVLFGHIHYPGIWQKRQRWIINTGGYVSMVRAQVADLQGTTLRIHRVDLRDGLCHLATEPRVIALA